MGRKKGTDGPELELHLTRTIKGQFHKTTYHTQLTSVASLIYYNTAHNGLSILQNLGQGTRSLPFHPRCLPHQIPRSRHRKRCSLHAGRAPTACTETLSPSPPYPFETNY